MKKAIEKMSVHLQYFLGAFVKLRKATIRSCPSVRPYGTSQLPLDGFSWKSVFECFSNIYRENSAFIKIWEGYRGTYTKICVLLW